MENEFYQDELEQFLQDEVKQHRMYPSDHIWKNIRTELHGYKAWPALTFISLFIITALTVSTLLINHPDKYLVQVSKTATPVIAKKALINNNNLVPMASAPETEADYLQQIAPEQITAETFAGLSEINPDQETTSINNSVTQEHVAAMAVKTEISVNRRNETVSVNPSAKNITASLTAGLPFNLVNTTIEKDDNILYNAPETENTVQNTATTAVTKSTDRHSGADEYLKDFGPVTVNLPGRKNSKLSYEFYITPSTSYRRLSDQEVKDIIQPAAASAASPTQNIPLNPSFSADINSVVRHKPAMGLELGFGIAYKMNNRLKFKTGIQLNVRQYYIETFQSVTNDLASLSLINYRGIETISFYSPYNNNTGYKQTRLNNKVYQVSVPIGIQWDLLKGKHFGINTEASVQPTLALNNSTFLMATDYKHYAEGNDFIRKWNINTSVGLNISYQMGSNTLYMGPQVRYQHLPTYSNIYPIKEYLLDYGVRLGIVRAFK